MLLICYICAVALGPAHTHSLVGDSVSVSPQGSRLVDSVGLPVEFLSPLGPAILPQLFHRVPKLHPLLAVVWHPSESAAAWSLLEDRVVCGALCLAR